MIKRGLVLAGSLLAAPQAMASAMSQHQPAAEPPAAATRYLASGTVELGEGPIHVSLVVAGERAWLRLERSDLDRAEQPIDIGRALYLLSDRRFEFLWAALDEWAGHDLTNLRDRIVADSRQQLASVGSAEAVPQSPGPIATAPRTAAALELSDALSAAGRDAEALQVLRDALPEDHRRGLGAFDYSTISVRIAGKLEAQGRADLAVAELQRAAEQLGQTDFTVNVLANQAARLANLGRYAEALQTIDTASAGVERRHGRFMVAGGDHQLSWIRGCALWGLGRRDEANVIIRQVEAAEERGGALYGNALPGLRIRMRLCMRDIEGAADEMVAELRAGNLPRLAFSIAQPGIDRYYVPSGTMAALRNVTRLTAAIEAVLRPLPASYGPALREWRAAARD